MFRLLFLGNGWADFVEIWYALGHPLVTAYAVLYCIVLYLTIKTLSIIKWLFRVSSQG